MDSSRIDERNDSSTYNDGPSSTRTSCTLSNGANAEAWEAGTSCNAVDRFRGLYPYSVHAVAAMAGAVGAVVGAGVWWLGAQ